MMKYILFLTVIAITFGSCGSDKAKSDKVDSNVVDPDSPPVMTFDETTYDFGSISQGEKVKHTFYFKNTGNSPLVIHSAKGSCGCTIPDWPKEPIAPGKEGKIEVSFNSEMKTGHQEKVVTILANTQPTKNLIKITGDVIVPEKK